MKNTKTIVWIIAAVVVIGLGALMMLDGDQVIAETPASGGTGTPVFYEFYTES